MLSAVSTLVRSRFWLTAGIFLGVLPCSFAGAAVLNASIATLNDTGDQSSGTANEFTDAQTTSVTLSALGSVLVIASTSGETANQPGLSRTGSWRLSDGTTNSLAVDRFLSGANDIGMLTTTHIFTGLSSGSHDFALQHASDANNRVLTRDANLVAIPLMSSDASVSLNYGQQTLGNYTTTSTLLQATGLSTSVTLDASGKIAVFSSFNSETGGGIGARTGSWDLQVESSPNVWTTIGTETDRWLSGSNDAGAVSLMALTDQLDAGTYNLRLRTATDNASNSIDTFNATLAGVGLSFAGGYFPSFQSSVASDSTTAVWDTVAGLSPTPELTIEEGAVFVGSSFNLSTSGSNSPVTAEVAVGFDDPTYTAEDGTRYISSNSDLGNGGSVGLTGTLSAGTYDGNIHFGRASGSATLVIDNPNLIGFSMVSVIPEPSTLLLLLTGAVGLFAWRFAKTRRG